MTRLWLIGDYWLTLLTGQALEKRDQQLDNELKQLLQDLQYYKTDQIVSIPPKVSTNGQNIPQTFIHNAITKQVSNHASKLNMAKLMSATERLFGHPGRHWSELGFDKHSVTCSYLS